MALTEMRQAKEVDDYILKGKFFVNLAMSIRDNSMTLASSGHMKDHIWTS